MNAFWANAAANFLGSAGAGIFLAVIYVLIQWFLTATDIKIGYTWQFEGARDHLRNLRPSFDIRNRSRSRTYYLSNVAYLRNKQPVAAFDNKSIWGIELKPGSIVFCEAAALRNLTSWVELKDLEVHVRLQTGRLFWLTGSGPGQVKRSRIQRVAFWLRDKLEPASIPTE